MTGSADGLDHLADERAAGHHRIDGQCRLHMHRLRGIWPCFLYRDGRQRLADQHDCGLPHLHGPGHGHPRQPDQKTVGYYARNSNTQTVTSTAPVSDTCTSSSTNYNCSLGDDYLAYRCSAAASPRSARTAGGTINRNVPHLTYKVTGPAANGSQLAVGDTLTVQEQVYKPGWSATSGNFGYYSGPYQENYTVNAPAGTVINGPITTSATGITSSTFGQASATGAAACNYAYNLSQATTGLD